MHTHEIKSKIRNRIIKRSTYEKIEAINEYLLFTDNILEGLNLLDSLIINDNLLKFSGIVYEPIDQPIYLFTDDFNNKFGIKVCGSFNNWQLPSDVDILKSFIDLPDYVIYSLKTNKAILAGENTETASVGNAQWQREGRKVAASRLGVPFIYQTFYSGKDESRSIIREPNSLQVFNQLLYSIRYKVPSIVSYFENNFKGSITRKRNPLDSKDLFSDYIKAVLMADCDLNSLILKTNLEKEFFLHMISYLKETKFVDLNNRKDNKHHRILKDVPSIYSDLKKGIIEDSELFVDYLLDYIYKKNNILEEKYQSLGLDFSLLEDWNPILKGVNKIQIQPMLDYFHLINKPIKSLNKKFKIGILKTTDLQKYLNIRFPKLDDLSQKLDLDKEDTIIFPLRIWKISNKELTLSPDPESGEIVAFCELLAFDFTGKKTRNVFAYHIVDIPKTFKYSDVVGKTGLNKIHKAISNYIDLLILSNGEIVSDFAFPNYKPNLYKPSFISEVSPLNYNEEVAVVSVYLNQSIIKSDWDNCFIHTHHSSWQQITINGVQQKINRVSTKVDLIMQQNNKFMIAEGKDKYQSILSDKKIRKAMMDAGEIIDSLYGQNIKFDAFIYNLYTTPKKDPDFYADSEVAIVKEGILRGHFDDIAHEKNFVVIIVYNDNFGSTKFRTVFSTNFENKLRDQLENEFS